MNNINSTYNGNITSKTNSVSGVTSKTNLDVTSKGNQNIVSKYEEMMEREAFLLTAKRNASMMFAKYL